MLPSEYIIVSTSLFPVPASHPLSPTLYHILVLVDPSNGAFIPTGYVFPICCAVTVLIITLVSLIDGVTTADVLW